MRPQQIPVAHLPAIDSLRALAVSVVLIFHLNASFLPGGFVGVDVFFVISGYVVTGSLLRGGVPSSFVSFIAGFYARRFKRILPALLVCLLATVLASAIFIPDAWLSRAMQSTGLSAFFGFSNFLLAEAEGGYFNASSEFNPFTHTWSLAVEEQFYLFFPWLVFFTPRRWLLPLFWTLIGLAVGLRLWLWATEKPWVIEFVSTPTCLDALVGGSVLAHVFTFSPNQFQRLWQKVLPVFFLAWVVLVGGTWLQWGVSRPNFMTDVLQRLLFSVIAFWIIAKTVVGFRGWFGAFLEHPVMSFLGKISYGLYLYHNLVYNFYHTPPTHPVPRLLEKIHRVAPQVADSVVFQVALFFALTVGLATVSWFLVEKPANHLKRYFSY